MKQILVINNYDSFVYNIMQLLRESRHCKADIVYNDAIPFGKLEQYDGILLSPGPGIPREANQLTELIRTCRNTHPLLGICLGHQAIAESFGGRLLNLPAPRHGHESRLQLTDSNDILFSGIPQPIKTGRYHSWVVDPSTLSPELCVSSIDEEGHIMSFYHKSLPVHGVQFHPESYITSHGARMISNWLDSLS